MKGVRRKILSRFNEVAESAGVDPWSVPTDDPAVVDFTNPRWGHDHTLEVTDAEKRILTGSAWSTPRLRAGDIVLWLAGALASPVQRLGIVLRSEPWGDPPDMTRLVVQVGNESCSGCGHRTVYHRNGSAGCAECPCERSLTESASLYRSWAV